MQAIAGPHCDLLSCCCLTRSVKNVLLYSHNVKKPSRFSNSFSCRADIPLRAHGHSSEEKIPQATRRNGRRLLFSVMSGTALATCLERNSTALAAEEGPSEPVVAGSLPQLTAAEILPASELTTSEEAAASDAPAAGNALIRKLLARSKANKEKNDKARLDDYYKRNYKEYFEFVEGTIRGKKPEELTEAEKGIIEWLKNNR